MLFGAKPQAVWSRIHEWPIAAKGIALVCVPLVFQIVFVALVTRLYADNVEARQSWARTFRTSGDARRVLQNLTDSYADSRAYVLTGWPELRENLMSRTLVVQERADRIIAETLDSPDQNQRARTIAALAVETLGWLDSTREVFQSGDRTQAVERFRNGDGNEMMARLRREIETFLETESAARDQRLETLERARRRVIWALVLGLAAAVGVTLILGWVFSRAITRRFDRVGATAERLAAGTEPGPPIEGGDEIARLDEAIRRLAAERNRVMDALRESARQSRELYDSAPCGYHSVDANGLFLSMNQTELQWLGYASEEVIGVKNVRDILGPKSRLEFDRVFDELKVRGDLANVEFELVRKDGTVFPALLNAHAVVDEFGQFQSSRTTLFDITQRKQAEQTIRMYGDIVASVPIGLIILRLDDLADSRSLRLLVANPASSFLLGEHVAGMVGETMPVAFPGVTPATLELYADVVRQGRPREIGEMHYQDEKVASSYWSVKAFPLPDQCLGLAFENVTVRREAEARIRTMNEELEHRVEVRTADLAEANRELRQKTQENEMFVYSVSHDLRSPLVNLQGFSTELEKAGAALRGVIESDDVAEPAKAKGLAVLDGQVARSLKFIRTAVLRLSGIIDALLRLSRAGRLEYRRETVDMQRLVGMIVATLQKTIEESGAVVRVGDLTPVIGDRMALEQAFANLLNNALVYLDPARPGVIEVGMVRNSNLDGARAEAVYFVRDNGLGISPAHQTKVFQAFQRAHPEVGKGEGIGLAIVARVVERHRGRVWVESEPGQGSTFFVALPRSAESNPPSDPSGAPT